MVVSNAWWCEKSNGFCVNNIIYETQIFMSEWNTSNMIHDLNVWSCKTAFDMWEIEVIRALVIYYLFIDSSKQRCGK